MTNKKFREQWIYTSLFHKLAIKKNVTVQKKLLTKTDVIFPRPSNVEKAYLLSTYSGSNNKTINIFTF